MEDFSKPKVIYPETTQGAFFAYDESGIMLDKTCFMLISSYASYLQMTLSSKLFSFAYKRIYSSVELGSNGYQYNKHALIMLPVFLPKHNSRFLLEESNRSLNDKTIYSIYGLSQEEVTYVEDYLCS